MIFLSAVQSVTRTLIRHTILFINTSTMLGETKSAKVQQSTQSSFANRAAICADSLLLITFHLDFMDFHVYVKIAPCAVTSPNDSVDLVRLLSKLTMLNSPILYITNEVASLLMSVAIVS